MFSTTRRRLELLSHDPAPRLTMKLPKTVSISEVDLDLDVDSSESREAEHRYRYLEDSILDKDVEVHANTQISLCIVRINPICSLPFLEFWTTEGAFPVLDTSPQHSVEVLNAGVEHLVGLFPALEDQVNVDTFPDIYRGSLQCDATHTWLVFNVPFEMTTSGPSWALLDEVMAMPALGPVFRHFPYMQELHTVKGDEVTVVPRPLLVYKCRRDERGWYNVQHPTPFEWPEPAEDLWGDHYYFSSRPIETSGGARYALFPQRDKYVLRDMALTDAPAKMASFVEKYADKHVVVIFFHFRGVPMWCVKSRDLFTCLDFFHPSSRRT